MNRFNWIVKTLLLTTLLLLSRTAVSAIPETFEARYQFIAKGMVLGETLYKLEKAPAGKDAQYCFSTHTEPTGLAALMINKIIDEESWWKWQNGELRPLQYRYQQSGKKTKVRTRDFNWEAQQVSANDNGNQKLLNGLQPGTVDEALFLIALMRDLQQKKSRLRYPIVRSGNWSHYEFTKKASAPITVPAGKYDVVNVVRQSEGGRSFQLWAAPSLGYLPVQVEYREKDGDLFLLKLKKSSLQKSP